MNISVFVIGVAALGPVAAAQVTLWSPRVSRTTGVATLVHYPSNASGTQTGVGTISVPANHFVSGLEFTPDGRLWATVQGPAGSMQQGLYSINRSTGIATQIGAPFGLAASEVITDLCWNPVTHRLTGMATPTSGGLTSRLLNFDIHSGAVASSATLSSVVSVLHVGVACRSNGEYLMLDVYNEWISRKVENNAVWLGNILSFTTGYNQGIGADLATGTIWYASFRLTNNLQGLGVSELRTVSPTTGIDTFIGGLSGNSTIFTDVAVEPGQIRCPADLTSDNLVEDTDFVSFASQYDALECGSVGMAGGCSGDFNFDGVVDDTDFVIFAVAYDALVCP